MQDPEFNVLGKRGIRKRVASKKLTDGEDDVNEEEVEIPPYSMLEISD
jgi:hypothetical protein